MDGNGQDRVQCRAFSYVDLLILQPVCRFIIIKNINVFCCRYARKGPDCTPTRMVRQDEVRECGETAALLAACAADG
jgi:hypothetical protein